MTHYENNESNTRALQVASKARAWTRLERHTASLVSLFTGTLCVVACANESSGRKSPLASASPTVNNSPAAAPQGSPNAPQSLPGAGGNNAGTTPLGGPLSTGGTTSTGTTTTGTTTTGTTNTGATTGGTPSTGGMATAPADCSKTPGEATNTGPRFAKVGNLPMYATQADASAGTGVLAKLPRAAEVMFHWGLNGWACVTWSGKSPEVTGWVDAKTSLGTAKPK